MSLARSLLSPVVRQQAALPPSDTRYLRDPFISAGTDAGPTISAETALFLTVVVGCVQVIVDAITEMPCLTYQRVGDKDMQVDGAWQHELLHNEPNPEMDAAQFWGDVTGHGCLDWNAFIGKTFTNGRVSALWPIRPDWVRVERQGGQKLFWVKDEDGAWYRFTQAEIIHVRFGFGFDGLRSVSPVKLAAQQIGAGIAMEKFMNEFWRNGALPTLVLQTDKDLGTDGVRARQLANRFLRAYRARRRGVVVLEDGVEAKPLNWSHVDAQFIEQKRELVETIARVWRVPLSKLMTQMSGSSMTYRNLEQERQELYGDAVLPKAIRIESALRRDRDLFPRALSLFPKFNADEVLRADSLTRARVNQIRTGGAAWAEVDEIRDEENMPPSAALTEKQRTAAAAPTAANADRPAE